MAQRGGVLGFGWRRGSPALARGLRDRSMDRRRLIGQARVPVRLIRRSCAFVLLLVSASGAGEATFSFAPPDGLECLERRHQEVVKDAGKAGGTTHDVTDATVRLRFARRRDGWRITSTVTSAEVTRNGTRVTEPVTAALVGRDVVYEVGPDGTLTAVRGLEAVAETATRSVPAGMRAAMAALLDPAAFERRERAEWGRRIGALAGRHVREGEEWEEAVAASGDGGIALTSVTRVARVEAREGRTVVHLEFASAPDAAAARRRLAELRAGMPAAGRAARTPRADAPVVEGDGGRAIEAGTMTVLWERLRQVTVAPADVPDIGRVTVHRTDARESTYRCTVPAATP